MIPWHWAVIVAISLASLVGVIYFAFIRQDQSQGYYLFDPVGPMGCIASVMLGVMGVALTLAIAGWLR